MRYFTLAILVTLAGCSEFSEFQSDPSEMTEEYYQAYDIPRFQIPFCEEEGAVEDCEPLNLVTDTFYVVLNDHLRTVALVSDEERILSSANYQGSHPPYSLAVTMGTVCLVNGLGTATPVPIRPPDYPEGIYSFILIGEDGLETERLVGHFGYRDAIEDVWGIRYCEDSLWSPCFIPM